MLCHSIWSIVIFFIILIIFKQFPIEIPRAKGASTLLNISFKLFLCFKYKFDSPTPFQYLMDKSNMFNDVFIQSNMFNDVFMQSNLK